MIKRLVALLALPVAVTGCGLLPKADSVPLLTWTGPPGRQAGSREEPQGWSTSIATSGRDLTVGGGRRGEPTSWRGLRATPLGGSGRRFRCSMTAARYAPSPDRPSEPLRPAHA